jgi:hypothetical protein
MKLRMLLLSSLIVMVGCHKPKVLPFKEADDWRGYDYMDGRLCGMVYPDKVEPGYWMATFQPDTTNEIEKWNGSRTKLVPSRQEAIKWVEARCVVGGGRP